MIILLLDSYFKINDEIYGGILEMNIWNFNKVEMNECSLLPISFPPT